MDEIEFVLLKKWTIGISDDEEAVGLRLLTAGGEQIDILLPLEAAEGISEALVRAVHAVRGHGRLRS